MKKIVILFLLAFNVLNSYAQYYESCTVEQVWYFGEITFCANDNLLGVIIYGLTNCDNNSWSVTEDYVQPVIENEIADSIIIYNSHQSHIYEISYGCDKDPEEIGFIIIETLPINPFGEIVVWKKQNESLALNATTGYCSDYLWSTGETTKIIEVSEPEIYSVTLTNSCGSATYSVEVRDNVELYRATVDLRTNKNKVTWLVTPEQAEYITDVKIYRDGVLVDTAPYTNGYFLDAIGSDAAARTYQIVGVSKEGDDCPIASYQKGTIHTTYYLDVNNNINMTWNIPYVEEGAQGQLTGFEIYKYNPATEELTLIDAVNASITDYTCNANAFIGGQATIAAVFSSKDMESRSFSNLNTVLAVDENEGNNFKIYPNPAICRITVEGTGSLSITNIVGQTILTKEIDGQATIELPRGMYFVQMNGVTRKIVVE